MRAPGTRLGMLAIAFVLLAGREAAAELVFHLRNGHRMTVESYSDEGDRYRAAVAGGTVWIEKNDVLAIEGGEPGPKGKDARKGKPDSRTKKKKKPDEGPAASAEGGKAVSGLPAPAPTPAPADAEGRTEKWWRDRVAGVRKQIEDFRKEHEYLAQEIEKIEKSAAQGTMADEARDRLGYYRVRRGETGRNVEDLKHILDVLLPEEARRAGTPPGWLRERN